MLNYKCLLQLCYDKVHVTCPLETVRYYSEDSDIANNVCTKVLTKKLLTKIKIFTKCFNYIILEYLYIFFNFLC